MNDPNHQKTTIGVVSDTHGILRPEVLEALAGVDLILHAGDIDTPPVLEALREAADVVAVRGNMDFGPLADDLQETEFVTVGAHHIYLIHDVGRLDLDPTAADVSVVVFGHSHRPGIERRNGVLFINPGSAGPRRFTLPVTVARLRIRGGRIEPEIIELDI